MLWLEVVIEGEEKMPCVVELEREGRGRPEKRGEVFVEFLPDDVSDIQLALIGSSSIPGVYGGVSLPLSPLLEVRLLRFIDRERRWWVYGDEA